MPEGISQREAFTELCEIRSEHLIRHAFDGFGLGYDESLKLIQSEEEELSDKEKKQRVALMAALTNLIDFACAEECQMVNALDGDDIDDFDFDEEDIEYTEEDEEDDEEAEMIFSRYNARYARVENADVEYAMIVASKLLSYPDEELLMYMTMGDERVRPWHLDLEGFTAPASSFPAWMVPPIEHQCRCYLVDGNSYNGAIPDVSAAMVMPEPPHWFNKTFKECVAYGGRIFSDEHPYFTINSSQKKVLREIAELIKTKYLGRSTD